MRRALPLLLLCAGVAHADVAELSLRPYAELRFATTTAPDGGPADLTGLGGGALIGLGLSFAWSLTARYGFEHAGSLSATRAQGSRVEFVEQRHLLLAGLAWAPRDAWTPLLLLESGLALRRQADGILVRSQGGTEAVDAELGAQTDALPVVRLTALFEWRLTDQLSLAPGALAELCDGRLGFGAQLMLGLYRYL